MAIYAYRCPHCSEIEVNFPIGTAPAAVPCPNCGAASVRVLSAPMLARTPAAMHAQLQRAQRSASEPEVVTSLPRRRGGGAVAAHPATSRLPRP
ncbi:FmdB family zinc ribbon protein [Sphaerisporangium perillae]|uniref:FmdB family zinc ribbon protein n=1 Tax=Sphaerisporangium perillae TaxID=2935860 RepID=UPI00200D2EFB|nr:zinc ribbon domain-containing protein [Sphaerisporangium perillae]